MFSVGQPLFGNSLEKIMSCSTQVFFSIPVLQNSPTSVHNLCPERKMASSRLDDRLFSALQKLIISYKKEDEQGGSANPLRLRQFAQEQENQVLLRLRQSKKTDADLFENDFIIPNSIEHNELCR